MDFKNGITIQGVAVQPGYPQLAGLTPGHALVAVDGTTVGFGPVSATLPANVAYTDSDNQFSAGQGIRGAASGSAAGLALPMVAGDTLPTLFVGGWASGMTQTALLARSLSAPAVAGETYGGIGVLGRATSTLGVPLVGSFDDGAAGATPRVLTVRHRTSGVPAAGFGAELGFALDTETLDDRDAATIAAIWTDAADATRTSALLFATIQSGQLCRERMRLTGAGRLGLNTTPESTLHLVMRDDDLALARGLIIENYNGTNTALGTEIQFRRGGGTADARTVITAGQTIATLRFQGYAGAGLFTEAASLQVRAVQHDLEEVGADLIFSQNDGGTVREPLRLSRGRLGVQIGATPTYTVEVQQPDLWPAINIRSVSTNTARASIGLGLNTSGKTGWVVGQSLGYNTTRDF